MIKFRNNRFNKLIIDLNDQDMLFEDDLTISKSKSK